jgi:CBS domain containing-hemolysin-like protein
LVVGLLLTVFFIALNGFFVAAEFALVKVNTTRAMETAKGSHLRVRVARDVVARLDRRASDRALGARDHHEDLG